MEDTRSIARLLHKYLQEDLSADELQRLQGWADSDPLFRQYLVQLKSDDQILAGIRTMDRLTQADSQDYSLNLHLQVLAKIKQEEVREIHHRFSFKWLYTAAALLTLGMGIFFWEHGNFRSMRRGPVPMQDIVPGTNRATLTLSDGRKIDLDNKQTGIIINGKNIKYTDESPVAGMKNTADEQDSLQASHTAVPRRYTLSTPKGGTYQILLDDGTKVWLNAASTLTYPRLFTGPERIVEITGEAYFQVAQNSEKPFKIKANGQMIDILGTELNINAYENENTIRTTLVSGSVRVEKNSRNRVATDLSILLLPGEETILSNAATGAPDGGFRKQKTDIAGAIAWKLGLFDFNQRDFGQVMRQLERWYDIEVSYEGKVPQKAFWGQMTRMVKLSTILTFLKESGVRFRLEGRKLIVLE